MDDQYTIEGTKSPETRLNIDDFSTTPAYKVRWDLFLRALAVVQSELPENPLGYYRIAGIHGWPIVTWPYLKEESGKTMYCSHGNARFLTWHRPYLLLLEERIVQEAHALAARAPRDLVVQYLEEARKIRIPFWDWADIPALPDAATSAKVSVIIPEQGTVAVLIDNPLYSYRFTGLSRAPAGTTTTRFPDATVNASLVAAGLKARVYHALTTPQAYAPFSNTRFPVGNDSIESPHNSVHNCISEIMQDPLVTAFDPLFWSFHGVIDYYYALWQAVNPTKFFSDNQPNTNTIDYPLPPFNRRRPFRPWTSRMIQRSSTDNPTSWSSGVQYPETTPTSTVADALMAINRYAPIRWDGRGGTISLPGAIPVELHRRLPHYPEDLPDVALIRREWRVVIKVKNNLVASNFTIYFFLGAPGARDQWGSDAATVGSFSTFKAPLEACENCRTAEGAYMYGSVYMTDELYKRLPNTIHLEKPTELKPWLIEKLDWRIRKVDGTEFTLPLDGDGTSLYVGVESFFEAYAPPNASDSIDLGKILGRTFDHQRHIDVTRGKSNKGGEIIAG